MNEDAGEQSAEDVPSQPQASPPDKTTPSTPEEPPFPQIKFLLETFNTKLWDEPEGSAGESKDPEDKSKD